MNAAPWESRRWRVIIMWASGHSVVKGVVAPTAADALTIAGLELHDRMDRIIGLSDAGPVRCELTPEGYVREVPS